MIWTGLGMFVAFAGFAYFDHLLKPHGLALGIGPLAAVCTILLALPQAPAAKKWNVIVSHIGCAVISVLVLSLWGPTWFARCLGIAASVVFMQFTDCIHPPAAGLPLVLVDGPKFHSLNWAYVAFPGLLGCVWLFLVQAVVFKLKERFKF